MEILKLVKQKDGHYQQAQVVKDEALGVMNNVFVNDGIDFDYLVSWLTNHQYSTFASNSCAFVHIGDNVVMTCHDGTGQVSFRFTTHHQKFSSLIEQWKKIYEEKPKQIIITHDDADGFKVEAK